MAAPFKFEFYRVISWYFFSFLVRSLNALRSAYDLPQKISSRTMWYACAFYRNLTSLYPIPFRTRITQHVRKQRIAWSSRRERKKINKCVKKAAGLVFGRRKKNEHLMDSSFSCWRGHADVLLRFVFCFFFVDNFAFQVNVCDDSTKCVSVIRFFIFAIYHFSSFFFVVDKKWK